MSPRALAVALGIVIIAGILALAVARIPPSRETIDDNRAAVDAARRACAHVDEFATLVARNATADEVFAKLDAADDAADEAAALDPYWIALAGATGAMRIALDNDDPAAARVAAGTARAECARVRAATA